MPERVGCVLMEASSETSPLTDRPVHERVLLLCSDSESSRAVCAALRREFGDIPVIREQPGSRRAFLLRRARRLGWTTVIGQILFAAIVVPLLRRLSRRRINAIRDQFRLETDSVTGPGVVHVTSVNADEARETLRRLRPDVVVVNGTRIISEATLACVSVPFINTHHGITPLYRGVHGGYWALVEHRADLVGSTIHFVDRGIDTGGVIEQVRFEVSTQDNFTTLPLLHTGTSIPVLIDIVKRLLDDPSQITARSIDLPSVLRTHPTLWGYLLRMFRDGVR